MSRPEGNDRLNNLGGVSGVSGLFILRIYPL